MKTYLGYLLIREDYLLNWRVLDSVGVIIIVDDLKVFDRLCSVWTRELHIQWCFSCSFGVNREVSGLSTLHTCRRNSRLLSSTRMLTLRYNMQSGHGNTNRLEQAQDPLP